MSAERSAFPILLGESRSPLWSDEREAELAYQRGKVQNLRRATRELNCVVLPAGSVFSFWRQIGRASRRRGYVVGPHAAAGLPGARHRRRTLPAVQCAV